jgi:hypothetical protein
MGAFSRRWSGHFGLGLIIAVARRSRLVQDGFMIMNMIMIQWRIS